MTLRYLPSAYLVHLVYYDGVALGAIVSAAKRGPRGNDNLLVARRTMDEISAMFGAVIIGRNEGERLKRCLTSSSHAWRVVYVDSGSTDGSVEWVQNRGVEVVALDSNVPFTAGRARNSGFRRLRELGPDIRYVQFIDGDCELAANWLEQGACFLDKHTEIGAVVGRLDERHPDRSIYNWLCDKEWNGPIGEIGYFGGIVMIRASAFAAVSGFHEEIIAGEEPELAFRLRAAGWRLWRLDRDMAIHDAAMTRFGQWWRRATRTGYAFANGVQLHGSSPHPYWVWESRRAWLWGVWFPLGCLTASLLFSPWGCITWVIYPLQILRQTVRNGGSLSQRAKLSFFQVLGRFPEALGQIKFMRDRLSGRRSPLIEYK